MRFGDLAAKYETDAVATRLCSEERYKKVVGIRKTRPFVFYQDLKPWTRERRCAAPQDANGTDC